MDYDGHNQRPITAHRSLSLAPDWSPDGQLLAYVTWVRGTPGIFVADFTRRGEKRALITDPENLPHAIEGRAGPEELAHVLDPDHDPGCVALRLSRAGRLTHLLASCN